MKRISLTFDEKWYYEDGGAHIILVRKLRNELTNALADANVDENTSLNEINIEYRSESSDDDLRALIVKCGKVIIGDSFEENAKISFDSNADKKDSYAEQIKALLIAKKKRPAIEFDMKEIVSLDENGSPTDSPGSGLADKIDSLEDAAIRCEKSAAKTEAVEATKFGTETKGKQKESALSRSEGMIGAEKFKALCQSIHARAEKAIRNKTTKLFFQKAYLFCADSGCGCSMALEILADLLFECKLFDTRSSVEKYVLPPASDHEYEQKMIHIRSSIDNAMVKPRVISIDISELLDVLDSDIVKQFVLHLFVNNKNNIIVFRSPFLVGNRLSRIEEIFNDVISVRSVCFEPFSGNQLWELTQRKLRSYNFMLDDSARDIYDRIIQREQKIGKFYNAHTVQKIIGDIVECAESTGKFFEGPDSYKIISRDAIISLDYTETELNSDALMQLRNMVGMESMEKYILEIANQIRYAQQHSSSHTPCRHMCFVGNPGTGKTTVARLLAQTLAELNILRVGNLYEYHGRDLCAQYVGQTAPKTKSICKQAYGSVLFIDEAYSLAQPNSSGDFGHEAIDTLVAEMENHSQDFVVIFAGYSDDIERLLDDNPGLRSRVPYTIYFPNYSKSDLAKIFMKMVSDDFAFEEGFQTHVEEYFNSISDETIHSKTFGNARFVRNLYERVWGKAVNRCGENSDIVLTIEDFNLASAEMNLPKKSEKSRVGF